jgi:hypothetical protein
LVYQAVDPEEDTVPKTSIITALLALGATLFVPSAALAAPKPPVGITYNTTATGADFTLPATVAGLHFEQSQFFEVCTPFDVTVNGSFQYWTGSEFATYTQNPVPQRNTNCQGIDAFRQDLAAFYLDCEAGTFDLFRFTSNASTIYFTGSDGGTLISGASLTPLVLSATTIDQGNAICDLENRLPKLSDKKMIAKLNDLLTLFSTT